MHPNLERVRSAAAGRGVTIEIERFPEGTRTAADAARAVGSDVSQIVKSLVFVADGRPVVVLVSGSNRVDPARLGRELGASDVRRADGNEARAATGFAIGGVPPFGYAGEVPVLVDRALLDHPVVWAAAGMPDAVFRIAPNDLVRAASGRVADLAERAGA